jgi:formate hydrogenlyase subunit 3/multisubunit Na+/H+ antiporter MnhD subunit
MLIIILLEFLLMVIKFVHKFILDINEKSLVFPIIEIIVKGVLFSVILFMFTIFIKLVNFFKDKKEEKMTKFQRHVMSCKHGTIAFVCKFLGLIIIFD